MTNKNKAAIEEAAKLPTAEETLSAAYKEAGWMYQLSVASGSCDHVSIALAAIESHTQTHTAALREEIKQLQSDVAHNADKALEIAVERDALQERVKELEGTLSAYKECFEQFVQESKWDEATAFLSSYGNGLAKDFQRKETQ